MAKTLLDLPCVILAHIVSYGVNLNAARAASRDLLTATWQCVKMVTWCSKTMDGETMSPLREIALPGYGIITSTSTGTLQYMTKGKFADVGIARIKGRTVSSRLERVYEEIVPDVVAAMLPNVHKLQLAWCKLPASGTYTLQNLTEVNIVNCDLSGCGWLPVTLRRLHVRNIDRRVTQDDIDGIARLSGLRELVCLGGYLTGSLSLTRLLTSLQDLDALELKVSVGLSGLESMPLGLTRLVVRGTHFHSDALARIGELSRLEELVLCWATLPSSRVFALPAKLKRLCLQYVDLANPSQFWSQWFSSRLLVSIAELAELEHLELRNMDWLKWSSQLSSSSSSSSSSANERQRTVNVRELRLFSMPAETSQELVTSSAHALKSLLVIPLVSSADLMYHTELVDLRINLRRNKTFSGVFAGAAPMPSLRRLHVKAQTVTYGDVIAMSMVAVNLQELVIDAAFADVSEDIMDLDIVHKLMSWKLSKAFLRNTLADDLARVMELAGIQVTRSVSPRWTLAADADEKRDVDNWW